MRLCSPNLSIFSAINLSSNYLWIFKSGFVHQIFLYSEQLTCHPIICEFLNCALFAKSFHIHWKFIYHPIICEFQIVCCSPIFPQSFQFTYHPIKYEFRIFLKCVIRKIFPQSMQSTYLSIICEFSNCALFPKSFHIHCN